MLKRQNPQILFFILLNLFFSINVFSQKSIYAGIEIGRRAIKVSVIDVNNIKKADYKILSFWTERIPFADHIAASNALPQEDINRASVIVSDQLKKIRSEYKILEENIFIVAAPVFQSARNIDVLKNKIASLTNKQLEVLDVNEEAKTLVKGAIPPVDYANAFLLDIGAQTTKGGYIDELKDNKLEFIPLELDFGTMTLTDAVQKTVVNPSQANDMSAYQEKSFDFNSVLRKKVKDLFDKNPLLFKKDKMYLSGGAVWAFSTLYYNENVKEHYIALTLQDVIDYDAILKNNFGKFTALAKTNSEAARVLSTYEQKYLISANNILVSCLEAMPNLDTKKIYFVKEGQVTWLISFIAERSKKVNTNF
ncbi:Ppx/GppA phosphatase family protein [Flavobacterium johnsoniae]|uniref:Exopolyphosphatase-like protein n=1 Tax=Flavobacterium johnsoniae (strain ATCC 17061 / DSM 2064 / JCM 8514 / BCRC 14874 / CCUG 350202 / NBRC 14942 / NCIMB 11054 / UW101) TaxID=376686 RepID=A5FIS7_FLAJ1|nr:exopolyphosphatase [Flavobacterium johnsoniae]ABQ04900.1 Exopolyphosphatase-like protein [Flavobacterium johnsoniae UW101]OXG02902.1 exopolyphosphatase [Flavobacterium johnsoniae UW101]WQG83302.1 exopolyphosphatase [Flavobacterium johnsoniae UW101]SHK38235.1 Ppx/GppA phosphatase family protein [Flavobacterium johnsoniae]